MCCRLVRLSIPFASQSCNFARAGPQNRKPRRAAAAARLAPHNPFAANGTHALPTHIFATFVEHAKPVAISGERVVRSKADMQHHQHTPQKKKTASARIHPVCAPSNVHAGSHSAQSAYDSQNVRWRTRAHTHNGNCLVLCMYVSLSLSLSVL